MAEEKDYINAWCNPSDDMLANLFRQEDLQDGHIKDSFRNLIHKRQALARYENLELKPMNNDTRYMVEIHDTDALEDTMNEIKFAVEFFKEFGYEPTNCFVYPRIMYNLQKKMYELELLVNNGKHSRKNFSLMEKLHIRVDYTYNKAGEPINRFDNLNHSRNPWDENPNLAFKLTGAEKHRMQQDLEKIKRETLEMLERKKTQKINKINEFFSA